MTESNILSEAKHMLDTIELTMDRVTRLRATAMDLVDQYETRGEEYAENYALAGAAYSHLYEGYRHIQSYRDELVNLVRLLEGTPWV